MSQFVREDLTPSIYNGDDGEDEHKFGAGRQAPGSTLSTVNATMQILIEINIYGYVKKNCIG